MLLAFAVAARRGRYASSYVSGGYAPARLCWNECLGCPPLPASPCCSAVHASRCFSFAVFALLHTPQSIHVPPAYYNTPYNFTREKLDSVQILFSVWCICNTDYRTTALQPLSASACCSCPSSLQRCVTLLLHSVCMSAARPAVPVLLRSVWHCVSRMGYRLVRSPYRVTHRTNIRPRHGHSAMLTASTASTTAERERMDVSPPSISTFVSNNALCCRVQTC